MPFLDAPEAESRLRQSEALKAIRPQGIIKPLHDSGLTSGRDKYSEPAKVLLGTLAAIENPHVVHKATGVNRQTLAAFAEGKTTFAGAVNPELKKNIDSAVAKFKDKIQTLSSVKVIQALDRITEEKLDQVQKATDLANIAATLNKLTATEQSGQQNNVQFNIYRPRVRDEDEYQVIEVQE